MLSRKIFVCVVLLLPATVLASLTLTAQETAQTEIRKESFPAPPMPQTTNVFTAPFGASNSRLTYNRIAGTSSWGNRNDSPVQKAFFALKEAEEDTDKAPLKTDLRKALVADYDSKMDQYDEHIESLEKELEQMRDRLSRRRAAKEEMVDLKLKEMLANADGLGWPSSPTQNRSIFQRSPTVPRFAPARVQEAVPVGRTTSEGR